jgi:recombinational DNA repair ATPase RecF
VFLLQLAAQKFWALQHGPVAVWLLDDLGSELDLLAIRKILAALEQSSSQAFVSAIAGRDMRPSGYLVGPVFHVEQGKLIGLDSYL